MNGQNTSFMQLRSNVHGVKSSTLFALSYSAGASETGSDGCGVD